MAEFVRTRPLLGLPRRALFCEISNLSVRLERLPKLLRSNRHLFRDAPTERSETFLRVFEPPHPPT
jgi:hypothetical protein